MMKTAAFREARFWNQLLEPFSRDKSNPYPATCPERLHWDFVMESLRQHRGPGKQLEIIWLQIKKPRAAVSSC